MYPQLGTDHSEGVICEIRLVLHVEGCQLAKTKERLQQLPAVQLSDACIQQTCLCRQGLGPLL